MNTCKNLAAVIIAVSFALVVTACGGSPTRPSAPVAVPDPVPTESSASVISSFPSAGGTSPYFSDVRMSVKYANTFGDVDAFAVLSPFEDKLAPPYGGSLVPIQSGTGTVNLQANFGNQSFSATHYLIIVFKRRGDTNCLALDCSVYHQSVPFEMNYSK